MEQGVRQRFVMMELLCIGGSNPGYWSCNFNNETISFQPINIDISVKPGVIVAYVNDRTEPCDSSLVTVLVGGGELHLATQPMFIGKPKLKSSIDVIEYCVVAVFVVVVYVE